MRHLTGASTPPQLPPSGILRPLNQGIGSTVGQASSASVQPLKLSSGNRMSFPPGQFSKSDEMFHVFSWAENKPAGPIEGPNFIVLQKQLSEVEEFLTAETNGPDRRAYLDAEMSTRNAVYEYLEKLTADMQDPKMKPCNKQDYAERVDIFNAADSLFRFFLPPLFDGPTTDIFWGAVMNLIWVWFCRLTCVQDPVIANQTSRYLSLRPPRRSLTRMGSTRRGAVPFTQMPRQSGKHCVNLPFP